MYGCLLVRRHACFFLCIRINLHVHVHVSTQQLQVVRRRMLYVYMYQGLFKRAAMHKM